MDTTTIQAGSMVRINGATFRVVSVGERGATLVGARGGEAVVTVNPSTGVALLLRTSTRGTGVRSEVIASVEAVR